MDICTELHMYIIDICTKLQMPIEDPNFRIFAVFSIAGLLGFAVNALEKRKPLGRKIPGLLSNNPVYNDYLEAGMKRLRARAGCYDMEEQNTSDEQH